MDKNSPINLTIKNLSVTLDEKAILDNISFNATKGQVIAILGPNGAGKSTLLKSIIHHYSLKIVDGEIDLNNENITNKTTDEIARLGFFLAFQTPVELPGVQTLDFLKSLNDQNKSNKPSFVETFKTINGLFDEYKLEKELLKHSVNIGYSGGQKKKAEMIQSSLSNCKILLLDEIDSGLDIDAAKLIAESLNKNKQDRITILVSHNIDFLTKIIPDKVFVLSKGKIVKSGGNELIETIKNEGYKSLN